MVPELGQPGINDKFNIEIQFVISTPLWRRQQKRAEYIFTRMIYICENLCDIHPYVTLEQLENSIRTSKYAVSFC